MSVNKITHQGQTIVYVDYRLKAPVEMNEILIEALRMVKETASQEGKVNLLVDQRGVPVSNKFIKNEISSAKPYVPYIRKSAIIGVTGIKRLFLEMYILAAHSRIRAFNNKEEALDYLVK